MWSRPGSRHDVVERRQAPAFAVEEEGMVAQMVIVVGNENVEHHPAEQFAQILGGFCPVLPDDFRKVAIGIVIGGDLLCFEHCQRGRERFPLEASALHEPVEALDEIDIAPKDLLQGKLGNVQSALGRKRHGCVLNATDGIGIVLGRKLGNPGRAVSRCCGLRARASQRRSCFEELAQVRIETLNGLHALRGLEECGKIELFAFHGVISPGRNASGAVDGIGSECQSTDAVIARRDQVIEFLHRIGAGRFGDEVAPPSVGRRIADPVEERKALCGTERLVRSAWVRQRQCGRIDRDAVGALQIAVSVLEDCVAVASILDDVELSGRDGTGRQMDVDESCAFTHRDLASEVERRSRPAHAARQTRQLFGGPDCVFTGRGERVQPFAQTKRPECACDYAEADAGIAFFQALQRVETDEHALGQQSLWNPAPRTRCGDVPSEQGDRLSDRSRQRLERTGGFGHRFYDPI